MGYMLIRFLVHHISLPIYLKLLSGPSKAAFIKYSNQIYDWLQTRALYNLV